ncbi:hypothetical protein AC739_03485 [Planococcus glaciei]|nr:hypothetical protein G159_15285 [Planococcus glaciei CHR43]KOF11889.1 hypothetical protein AC739_03485 [Planococcus glaciei]
MTIVLNCNPKAENQFMNQTLSSTTRWLSFDWIIVYFRIKERHLTGPATKTPVEAVKERRKLKTPQEQPSDIDRSL